MALSVSYTHFDGQLIYDNHGGVERFYVPDALGSTVALTDASGSTTDTFTYWPYGETLSRTGTTQTPFTFLGLIGYYTDALSRLYVRARYYLRTYARWLTADPLWPSELAFAYAKGRPNLLADPTGFSCCADTSVTGGCIAAMCSGKAAFDALKKLTDIPECLKDGIKKIEDLVKERGSDFNPDECCDAARKGSFPWSTDKDKLIQFLIGVVCKSTEVKCPSPNVCAKKFTNDNDTNCDDCCNALYPTKGQQGIGTGLNNSCKRACLFRPPQET